MRLPSSPKARVLRAKLLVAGHTLTSFAKKHRVPYATVKAAVRGSRKGPASQRVLEKIANV